MQQLIVVLPAIVETGNGGSVYIRREAEEPGTGYHLGRGYSYGKQGFSDYGFRSHGYGKRETPIAPGSYTTAEKRKTELAAIAALGGDAQRCQGLWWLQWRLPSLAIAQTRTPRLPC